MAKKLLCLIQECGEKWCDIAWKHIADEEYGTIDAEKGDVKTEDVDNRHGVSVRASIQTRESESSRLHPNVFGVFASWSGGGASCTQVTASVIVLHTLAIAWVLSTQTTASATVIGTQYSVLSTQATASVTVIGNR